MNRQDGQMKRYLRAVCRRLALPKRYRERVMSDFESSIQARREAGQSDEEIFQALGTPKQAAQELNTQMSPYTWRKSPWCFAALALAVLSALVLLMEGVWPVMLLPLNASVGVIGGADGPTAIFVAQQPQAVHTEMIIAAVLLVLGLAAYFRLRHCRRREP